jgi:D-sedoheptulose 7-phosphate isomerase
MENNEMAVHIRDALEEGRRVLQEFADDHANLAVLEKMACSLAGGFSAGNKVLCCGNGGSACDATHFAEELTGRFRDDRPALPAISLMDGAHLTCVANDYGFDEVFARGVMAYGKPGDLLLAISTSGNSRNVVRAVEAARGQGMTVLLMLGKSGGVLRGKGDSELWIRSQYTERVQEIHMLALHILIENVERILFPANYQTII